MSLNFALEQKENKSFTTYKDQSKRQRNRCARYISYQWIFDFVYDYFDIFVCSGSLTDQTYRSIEFTGVLL